MSDRSERILKSIHDSGLSYGELSHITGIPKSALQRYAIGETEKIPIDRIELIAKATSVSSSYLMGWESVDSEVLSLSPDEELILSAYRAADEIDQTAVRRILGLESRSDGFYERVAADALKAIEEAEGRSSAAG